MSFSFHRIPVGIDNCFLLHGERTILVDGGAPGGLNSFVRHMKQLNVEPKQIELIILTHGHWDHIASLNGVRELTGAKVAIHRGDQYHGRDRRTAIPGGHERLRQCHVMAGEADSFILICRKSKWIWFSVRTVYP